MRNALHNTNIMCSMAIIHGRTSFTMIMSTSVIPKVLAHGYEHVHCLKKSEIQENARKKKLPSSLVATSSSPNNQYNFSFSAQWELSAHLECQLLHFLSSKCQGQLSQDGQAFGGTGPKVSKVHRQILLQPPPSPPLQGATGYSRLAAQNALIT